MGIRYLLFDLDNTLYPKNSGVMQEISRRISLYMEQRLGMTPAVVEQLRVEYWQRYGTSLRGLQIHYGVDPDDYLTFVHDFAVTDYLQPNPALDHMLAQIPAEKVIFTNANAEYAWRILQALGVSHHFSRIFDIAAVDYINKPDEAAYRRVLAALQARPEECVIVEDIARNLEPAKRLGMITVLVDDEVAPWADYVIDDILELGDVRIA
jgi:putative hydrolase of the HAD superfamily